MATQAHIEPRGCSELPATQALAKSDEHDGDDCNFSLPFVFLQRLLKPVRPKPQAILRQTSTVCDVNDRRDSWPEY